MTSTIVYVVILVVGASSYLVIRNIRRPEVFGLIYTAALTAAALVLLTYLISGAATGPRSQRGAFIGESIIVGCFAGGLLFGTMRMVKLVRQSRRQ